MARKSFKWAKVNGAALDRFMHQTQIWESELAIKAGVSESLIRKMLNNGNCERILIAKVAKALGKKEGDLQEETHRVLTVEESNLFMLSTLAIVLAEEFRMDAKELLREFGVTLPPQLVVDQANLREADIHYKNIELTPEKRVELARRMTGVFMSFVATGPVSVKGAKDGSVIITVELNEGDCIRLGRSFGEGKLDEFDVARIDFKHSTRRMKSALSAVRNHNTRVSMPGTKTVSLARGPVKGADTLPPERRMFPSLSAAKRLADEYSKPEGWRFSLIELSAATAGFVLLIALLLPQVNAARERARRLQCTNNLMQLGLAAQRYHDDNLSFPVGGPMDCDPTAVGVWAESQSTFVSMLTQLEHAELYNAINFSRNIYSIANSTIHAAGLKTLWCPSDGTSDRAEDISVGNDWGGLKCRTRFTSYAGSFGIWLSEPRAYVQAPCGTKLGDIPAFKAIQSNGVGIYNYNLSYNISTITDGTSHTILYAEKANGSYSQATGDSTRFGRWAHAVAADTLFTTFYRMNSFQKTKLGTDYDNDWVEPASSFHPGGANFAFADGHVQFIRDSVDSWPAPRPGQKNPDGITVTDGVYSRNPAQIQLGVYQKLSTRSGGEVVNPDQF